MAPNHLAAQTDTYRIQQLCPAYFVVLLRREPSDHKVAVLAEEEEAIAILGHERSSFHRASFSLLAIHRLGSAPQAFPSSDAHGSKDAVPVDAVSYAVFDKRRAAHRGQPDGSRALPCYRDCGLRGIKLQP